ncbi:MAG: UDP-glucose 4-epimerase GalE [Burkholderiales bacterium PBB2]|nr:MAG: UDP-glucose 4-epimerase GalE [Burkholderiales bacterium PBB2]
MSSQLFPSAARRVLVTGGAGYIGSITVIRLIEAGWTPLILDNFSNSHPEVLQRIERLTGYAPQLYRADVRDRAALDRVFAEQRIDAVIHFAGLKAVGESVRLPLDYAEVNVAGSVQLLQAMRQHGVRHIVFSSSATVYGEARVMPLTEDMTGVPTSPYGRSKWQVEQILADLAASDPSWSVAALRYFNPVGAHPSGELGEDPQGTPNNLMPFIAQVAVGRQPELRIFGSDYPTVDGTGVRDYLHVLDLADGHVAALELLRREAGLHVLNLGTGRGHSVLELKAAFERACGRELPTRIVERRPGDVAQMWADASRARDKLGWQAQLSLQQMCDDTWRWQSRHPQGYRAR